MDYSVIIPVYNGEQYIEECLDSVLNQLTNSNVTVEILIIDDGSTDSTVSKCEKKLCGYPNAHIYSKKNEGLLLSRRFGLRKASGEWIVFVDADDYIEDHYFQTLERYKINNPRIDMIIFGNRVVDDNGRFIKDNLHVFKDGQLFSGKSKYNLFLELSQSTKINSIWRKVAKRSIYDIDTDYSVYGKVKGEDVVQSIPLLHNAECVVYCDEALYNYRMSISGLGRNIRAKYVYDYSKVYEALYRYLLKYYNDEKMLKAFYNQYFTNNVLFIKGLARALRYEEYKECCDYVFKDFKFIQSRKKATTRFPLNLYFFFESKLTFVSYKLFKVGMCVKKIINKGGH